MTNKDRIRERYKEKVEAAKEYRKNYGDPVEHIFKLLARVFGIEEELCPKN